MEIHILIWLIFDLVIHIFIIDFGELEREEKKGGLGGGHAPNIKSNKKSS